MNRVIIDIGLIRYFLNQKYKVISINSIMQFHEHCDYKYWIYKMYFKLKIKIPFNKINRVLQ